MRALTVGLMVLGLMGIALVGITSPASPVNKVVIGVLDFEKTAYPSVGSKEALMKELRRNTMVKLVDIHKKHSLSDLKKFDYLLADKYKKQYQLDMILHIYQTITGWPRGNYYFSLIDLYTKKVKEVSAEFKADSWIRYREFSRKLLVSGDLNRVLRAKKKVLAKKEVAVPVEVKEIPKEEVKESPIGIEDPFIQKGFTLITEGEYSRVLKLIEDLPGERRKHVHVQTLECFANLKGWVVNKDKICKMRWWSLRQGLIGLRDNEATPVLIAFLKDEDPWLRIYAAELLSHIGDRRALKDLREVGESDENRKVRKYAKRAYEQISGEKF